MAYTIKGLSIANECRMQNAYGLAEIWDMWFACDSTGKNVIKDFLRLRKADRVKMLCLLMESESFQDVALCILPHIYD